MNSENYGTHIKHIRQKMGLTQNQVAEALGVTPGYISNVENNRTDISLRILTYYAKLWLLSGFSRWYSGSGIFRNCA